MAMYRRSSAKGLALFAVATILVCAAEASKAEHRTVAAEKVPAGQEVLKLPVRVVDPNGKPIPKANVIPWALRSSQGHGWWRKGDEGAKISPKDVVTDANGVATVLYPKFADLEEQVR